jgi:hypothetical protein
MEQADRYFKLRQDKEAAEAALEAVKDELVQVEKDLVMRMENENMQSFKDATYGTIYLREQVYARLEDDAKAFEWFKANGMEYSWRWSIHNKTLCAIAKDHPDIPGVVTAYETKIGYRKGA